MRKDKVNYYLDIAEQVATRSTCLRRCYGAVLVRNDEIVATGYNGAPRGRKNCIDMGKCLRQEMGIKAGERYELCRSVHAEMNACLSAGRKNAIGSTLYVVGIQDGQVIKTECCTMCKRVIINSGVEKIICKVDKDTYEEIPAEEWIENDDSELKEG